VYRRAASAAATDMAGAAHDGWFDRTKIVRAEGRIFRADSGGERSIP